MGYLCAGCGFIGIVIHFEPKSGNQQGVSLILPSKLNEQTIPQKPHPAARLYFRRWVS